MKEITEDIAKYVIKEGQPIILIDEYSWYTEVFALMAKQVNLCDSCILLLENGMEQEFTFWQEVSLIMHYGCYLCEANRETTQDSKNSSINQT